MRHIGVITVLYESNGWNPGALAEDILNIVIDNTPDRDLSDDFNGKEGIHYIALGENRGIAYAQNIGIKEADKAGCPYLVFFDQDSEVDEKLVYLLRERFESHRASGDPIGALGPAIFEKDIQQRYKMHVPSGMEEGETTMLISSGMFTAMDVVEKVGMMESGLFIDLVDSEWCMRCRNCGYKIYVTNLCALPHKVGEGRAAFLGYPLISSATFRYYYKYRNSTLLNFRGYVPVKWKLKTSLRNIITFFLVPFLGIFKGRRRAVMGSMLRGVYDASKYKHGKDGKEG